MGIWKGIISCKPQMRAFWTNRWNCVQQLYITKLNSSLTSVMFSSPLSRSPPTSSWSWLWTSGAGTLSSTTVLPIFRYKSTGSNCMFHDLRKPLLVVMMLIPGAACVGAAFLKVSARFCSAVRRPHRVGRVLSVSPVVGIGTPPPL